MAVKRPLFAGSPVVSGQRAQRLKRNRRSPAVTRQDNRILFGERVNAGAHRQYMWCLSDLRQRGYEDVTLDFSQAKTAYPNGMIPILCSVDVLRREDLDVEAVLPDEEQLRRLFLNTNWAHFLCPKEYQLSDTTHDRHLATQRFRQPSEQQEVVNAFMDVVLRNVRLDRDVIAGLEWSINEITDNVLNHAECVVGGIVQLSTFLEKRMVAFAVGDSGRGVLASLREALPGLRSDAQAIGEAVKSGVTRNPEFQGNGLAGTLRIATMSGGSFEITSGRAQVVVQGDEARTFKRPDRQTFEGTLVSAQLSLDTRFHLAEALGFSGTPHAPVDLIETLYETEHGDAVILRLKDESTGFGSRPSGGQIRTKCLNLLDAEPNKPLILDWKGVPIVSSSFADELVGKLFVELGPLGFSARIRNMGMETLVRSLVDKAITQRVVQTATIATRDGEGRTGEQKKS